MLSVRLLTLSAILMCVIGCSSNSYPSSPSPTPSPTPSPAPTPGGSSSSVTIPVGASTLGDRAFAPDELNIAAGTTVTWMNTDTVAHTSTANGNAWNSGSLAPGGQFSFAFQSPGTFAYHCAIHPGMIGTVVVQ
jgi:plastocyanin